MNFFCDFDLPVTTGKIAIREFFPNCKGEVKVEKPLLDLLQSVETYEITTPARCFVYEEYNGGKFPILLDPINSIFGLNYMCAIFARIGSYEYDILDVPIDRDETKILLGYTYVSGTHYALVLRHKWENQNPKDDIYVDLLDFDTENLDHTLILKIQF